MKDKNNNSNILFNSNPGPGRPPNRPPNRNRPRGPYPPNPRRAGGGPQRGPQPKKKFIDDNLFLDPNINKSPKKKKPLPDNLLVIIIAALIGVVAIGGIIYYFVTKEPAEKEPDVKKNSSIFVGSWNCKQYIKDESGRYSPGDKYVISVAFDNDGKFIFGQYEDLNNNYTIGNYQFELLEKPSADLENYNLGLFANKAVTGGYIQTGNFKSVYKTSVSKKDGSMLLMNQNPDKDAYICSSHDRTNPKIEN